jgi:hypothetical protein
VTSATTTGATSFGYSNLSSGLGSFSQGFSTIASGISSHAEGVSTIAAGDADHAEGYNTIANSNYYSPGNPYGAHAEGWLTVAYGNASHAEGYLTQAHGVASHAEGIGTVTVGDYQHAIGIFNKTGDTTPGAFIIGNGTISNRSDLLFAANSGVTIYGSLSATSVSANTLDISGNNPSSLVRITQTGIGNAFVVEDSSRPDSSPFVIDTSGNTGIGTTTPTAKLHIKGIDSSSSNISFKVEDSSNRNILSARNDNFVYVGDNSVSSYLWTYGLGGQFGFSNENAFPYLFLNSSWAGGKFYFSNGSSGSGAFTQINTTNGNLLLGSPNTGVYSSILTDTKLTVIGVDKSTSNFGLKVQDSGGTGNFVVRNDGRVGVGTESPTSKLHVIGDTIISSGLTASTLNISSTPTTDTGTTTNVLVRDVSTGVIKQRDITSTLNKNYASFYDTGDQTGLANTVLTMSANTSDSWNTGITLSANTRFVIQNPGVYNLAFSAQMVKTGGNSSTHAHIWLYQNGLDVLYSASQIGFPSNSIYTVPAWNFFFSTTTPNEYVELKWEINSNVDNQLLIKQEPAAGSVPAIPSVIVTINQVN